jgi:hypothetical protein
VNVSMKAFDDMGNKWPLAEQFAQAVGASVLKGHQTVQNQSDGEVELRGNWEHLPVRMKLSLAFGDVEWEMKAPNPSNTTIYLHWDPDAVPNVGQFSGNFASDWDEDSRVKIFFGKGYYMEGDKKDLDQRLAVYQSFHEHVRNALVTYMIQDRIARLYLYSYGSMLLGLKDGVHKLADPVSQVSRAVWLMGQVAWGFSQLDPAQLASIPSTPNALHRMTCGYCRTLYLWSQNQACPNCGAPPRG